jgi:hypothetical protein
MRGKETLSKELIKHLPIKKDNQKDAAIQLPWKNENVDLKILRSPNVQQGDKQESNQTRTQKKGKVGGNPIPHRNCPKIMNDDFLWNWKGATKVRV